MVKVKRAIWGSWVDEVDAEIKTLVKEWIKRHNYEIDEFRAEARFKEKFYTGIGFGLNVYQSPRDFGKYMGVGVNAHDSPPEIYISILVKYEPMSEAAVELAQQLEDLLNQRVPEKIRVREVQVILDY